MDAGVSVYEAEHYQIGSGSEEEEQGQQYVVADNLEELAEQLAPRTIWTKAAVKNVLDNRRVWEYLRCRREVDEVEGGAAEKDKVKLRKLCDTLSLEERKILVSGRAMLGALDADSFRKCKEDATVW